MDRFRDRVAAHHPVAVCVSVAACAATLAVRHRIADRRTFDWLLFNLALAVVPWLFGLAVAIPRSMRGRLAALAAVGPLWLLFFPNAPYIVTDLLHLRERPPVPEWFDLGLIVTFAWTGCLLAFVSLAELSRVVKESSGAAAAWAFAAGTLALTGYGIYLGRVERWNSWDLFMEPAPLMRSVAATLTDPRAHGPAIGFSVFYAGMLLLFYGTFVRAASRLGTKTAPC